MSSEKVEMGPSLSMDDMRTDAVKVVFSHTHFDFTKKEQSDPIEKTVYYPIVDGSYIFFPVFCAVCHVEMMMVSKETV